MNAGGLFGCLVRLDAVGQGRRELEHEVKWTMAEHHASDPTVLLDGDWIRAHIPNARWQRAPSLESTDSFQGVPRAVEVAERGLRLDLGRLADLGGG